VNRKRLPILLAALVFLAAPLRAQDRLEDTPASRLSPDTKLTPRAPTTMLAPEKTAGNSQLVVYFIGLLALAGGGQFLLKRGMPLRGKMAGQNNLHLLETKILGNRQFLVVVQYEDNKMLLGVGPGQIQYLCPLDSADADMENLIRKGEAGPGPATL
jgi:flagellar protein FliO/FliZ